MPNNKPKNGLLCEQARGNHLHVIREQVDEVVWSAIPFMKLRPPITRAKLLRKHKALISALDDLTSHCPAAAGFTVPPLLVGVSQRRAQRLADNILHLYARKLRYLDQTDLATLRSFIFVEVADTVSQIGVELDKKHPGNSALTQKLCQQVQVAAHSLAVLLQ